MAYSRNLGQHSLLVRKGTFFEEKDPKSPLYSIPFLYPSTAKLQNGLHDVNRSNFPITLIKILGWYPAGPVLPHGEKVPL